MLFNDKHDIIKSFVSILLFNNKHLNFKLLIIQLIRVYFLVMLSVMVYSLNNLIFVEEEMVGFH